MTLPTAIAAPVAAVAGAPLDTAAGAAGDTAVRPPALAVGTALFLDFDGTLVAIAPRPQDVVVAPWVVPALAGLQQRLGGAVAIVSGRPLAQLDAFLAPLRLPAAGAHGAERRGADGRVDRRAAVAPPAAVAAAEALVQRHEGLLYEPKPSGFALHYRARPELEAACRTEIERALAGDTDGWQPLHGHCVVEVKLGAVSKGAAVRAFLAEPEFSGRTPVFVGDDVTDEDGIEAAQANGGFGVRVGGGASRARYRLADVDAVAAWLSAVGGAEQGD